LVSLKCISGKKNWGIQLRQHLQRAFFSARCKCFEAVSKVLLQNDIQTKTNMIQYK
jgi:hypothetical protein